jgi:hypothetical protein
MSGIWYAIPGISAATEAGTSTFELMSILPTETGQRLVSPREHPSSFSLTTNNPYAMT